MRRHGSILAFALAATCRGQVLLDEKQASEIVLRGCQEVERVERAVSPEDRANLEKSAGLRFPTPKYIFLICRGLPPRYAVVMNEIGKSEPITFMVGVEGDGKAGEVAVMVFRESRGGEVKEPRFTKQFRGKKLSDPLRIKQDIMNYTGATLSSEAMARGVKKALALVTYYYLKP